VHLLFTLEYLNCRVKYCSLHPHPCHHRGFYLSKHPQKPQKQHPIPGTITHLFYQSCAAFSAQINLKYFYPQQSQTPPHSTSTYTSISPTHLPNTSLTIAITDAIYSPKSHCYLMPSAGRQKKDWGRCWEVVVALEVAL